MTTPTSTSLPAQACVLWFTGLSGAGKSTTALAVQQALHAHRCANYLLDGDQLRQGLCRDLGFSAEAREENIRRIGEVAALMVDAGLITLVAAISPFQQMREQVRKRFAPGKFVEIFIDAPLAVCEARDPKGLYRRARAGEIRDFTGIDSRYEAPLAPELHIKTNQLAPQQAVEQIIHYLHQQHYLVATVTHPPTTR
ncbi:adenylyl-sulfate kinase [Cellvibrio japonicus]|uniref:Adenylyl-sulfate kinase n=1 Tax=Cellvibrio japonicus (strain Ueda107) TaxID=498211 RepID=B3PE89_CELJU|nr:adenylyl-sulfate kinase [Cellvibrio japonicus]ACE86283.1 adenylylsulfate kinase [Cellvibrio japonicus Ueda107]QEI12129.1 adenylyl-sulfate kinase [Cellvibrio japonicus]QEI15703.1 adenylyl-sulfate kinase [Cellvibrio japonicus]QEI19281.1 adenylyl-sulfate kinase [Cellvibrio japonicus]